MFSQKISINQFTFAGEVKCTSVKIPGKRKWMDNEKKYIDGL